MTATMISNTPSTATPFGDSNPFDEQTMTLCGATFTLARVDVTSIDIIASRKVQVRYLMVDRKLADRYAEAMEVGAKFPPIVLRRNSDGKYTVVDGNHRLTAAIDSGHQQITAYIVEASDSILKALQVALNVHGINLTEGEVKSTIRELVRYGEHTHGVIATICGVSKSSVQHLVAADNVRSTLHRPVAETVEDSVVAAFGGIVNVVVRREAFDQFVRDAKATRSDVRDLVRVVKRVESESEQTTAVQEYFAERSKAPLRPANTRKRTAAAKASTLMASIVALDPTSVVPSDPAAFVQDIQRCIRHLNTMKAGCK